MNKLFSSLILISVIAGTAACTTAVVGGAVAAGGTGVATATDARGSETVVSDQSLEHKINQVLAAEVPRGSFTVASYNQEVLLAGQVPNASAKAKAENATYNTVGVKKVWNYLHIGHNETTTAITHDAYITSSAKTSLIAQKGVNANNIKVVTSNKVVYLLGSDAGKPHKIQEAINSIKDINGVRDVVNLIKQ